MLIQLLEQFTKSQDRIETWLLAERKKAGMHPFYASSDLRNSGMKIGVVDTNLYPAGFNNLCKKFLRSAEPLIQSYFNYYFPQAKRIGILTEEHTRNTFYLENVQALKETISLAGFEVTVIENLESLAQNQKQYDCVIVNNDFSAGLPPLLSTITTPLIPPPLAGWHKRRKSKHFDILKEIIGEMATIMDFPAEFLMPEHRVVESVSITDETSRTQLADSASDLLKSLTKSYAKHGITQKPFLFMKDDAGTYGMGITTIDDASEILAFNKKRRDTFKFGKNKKPITSILLQEGIPSSERIHGFVSEPVVYMMNHTAVGGFFRMHETADERSSLNRPGMKFSKLCFHELSEYHNSVEPNCNPAALEALYFTLGACASLAASREIKEILAE